MHVDDGLDLQVKRLEREIVRLKRIVAALACGAVSLVLMGQIARPQNPGALEGQTLVLRDQAGRERVTLDASGLFLYDEAHKTRVLLGTSGVFVAAANGKTRAQLAFGPDGSPGLTLHDEDEVIRVALAAGVGGHPLIKIQDRDGNVGVTLRAENRAAAIALTDTGGRTRTLIATRPDGTPWVRLSDGAGRARVDVSSDANGAGMSLLDQGGIARLSLVVLDAAGGSPVVQATGKTADQQIMLSVADAPSVLVKDAAGSGDLTMANGQPVLVMSRRGSQDRLIR